MEELGDFGCLIPNCEETFWRYYAQDQYYDERFEGFSNVRFFFPSKEVTYFNFQTIHRMIRNQVLFVISKIQVDVIQEVLAYTKNDLLADFGGYMGMFVGASIMSIYDVLISMMLKLKLAIQWKLFQSDSNGKD